LLKYRIFSSYLSTYSIPATRRKILPAGTDLDMKIKEIK